jgi:DNA-binding transcriptional regulator YiaG
MPMKKTTCNEIDIAKLPRGVNSVDVVYENRGNTLGEILYFIRKTKNMTQACFAKLLKISPQYLIKRLRENK